MMWIQGYASEMSFSLAELKKYDEIDEQTKKLMKISTKIDDSTKINESMKIIESTNIDKSKSKSSDLK